MLQLKKFRNKKVNQTPRQRLLEIIKQKSVIRSSKGNKITTVKGGNGLWLLDLRVTFMDSEGLDLIAQLFWQKFADQLPFQVGGLEAGSVPLVAAIILEGRRRGMPINGFFVRKERKHTGRQHLIEGQLTPEPIVIVDDLMNSGGTLDKVVVALADEKRQVRDVFVVTNFGTTRGRDYLAEHGISMTSLFRLRELGLARSTNQRTTRSRVLFQRAWSFQAADPNYFYIVPKSAPVLDNTSLYFGSDTGIFWALDQRTGQPRWQFRAGKDILGKNIFSSPALHRGRVYFGSYDGNTYCLNTKTGKEIWRNTDADWIGSSPALAPDLGLLFIGREHSIRGRRGSVAAIDLQTGETVWDYTVRDYVHGSPAYEPQQQLVACGTNSSEMLLFSAKTGRLRWCYRTNGAVKYAPVFDTKRNQLIFGCHDGYIYVLDVKTGKEVWKVKTENIIYSTPLIYKNKAFVSSTDKHVYVLDLAKQKVLDVIHINGKLFASPRLIEGQIYIGSTSGIIHTIDPQTHASAPCLQVSERITNPISYNTKNKFFFVPTYANQIIACKKK